MTDDTIRKDSSAPENPSARKPLTPQAARALAEADERRSKATRKETPKGPKELQGPTGPEPTRFGDWERKGIASDF